MDEVGEYLRTREGGILDGEEGFVADDGVIDILLLI